ncbi:riboflavin kinase [Streptomyces sp. NPDC056987]|uniref:riboflavin kinase n=1 Tax=Streptomyces sp. NPDC056987 TaxID=3345988 RepID=UPI003633DABD
MTYQATSEDAGEPTVVTGVVRVGDRRGRGLGFPTANIHEVGTVRRDGVYAATVALEPDEVTFVAVVSVGHRPTYYGPEGTRLLEAHLLGFKGDLYGRGVRVTLRHRIRPQRRFGTSPALVRQLQQDVKDTARWAALNNLDHLITEPPRTERSKGRWGADQRHLPRDRCRPTLRALERTEAIVEAARHVPADTDPHHWVAARTGYPVADVAWRLAQFRTPDLPGPPSRVRGREAVRGR